MKGGSIEKMLIHDNGVTYFNYLTYEGNIMDNTFCMDGKKKTEMTLTTKFKLKEVDFVFSAGFSFIYPLLPTNPGGLLQIFVDAQKVARNALDEANKILKNDEEEIELAIRTNKIGSMVCFTIKFGASWQLIPIDTSTNFTKDKCIEVANQILSNREKG